MLNLSQDYEISIWREIIIDSQERYVTEERKIGILGGSKCFAPYAAYNINFLEKTNGEKSLSFVMPRVYNENGEKKYNPFLDLLQAESKIKLRDGAEYEITDPAAYSEEEDDREHWHEFLIKDISEDTDAETITISCKDAFVNELGKNGYDIALDAELKNNYGTLEQLTNRVLSGSGWKIDDNTYRPRAFVKEQLFVSTAKMGHDAFQTFMTNSVDPIFANNALQTTNETCYIYIFSSDVELKNGVWKAKDYSKSPFKMQVYLKNDCSPFTLEDANDDWEIIDDNYQYNRICEDSLSSLEFVAVGSLADPTGVKVALKGNRLVQSGITHYEPVSGRVVTDYQELSSYKLVYGYEETEFLTPQIVQNQIANSSNFKTLSGWYPTLAPGLRSYPLPPVGFTSLPDYDQYQPTNYLVLRDNRWEVDKDGNQLQLKNTAYFWNRSGDLKTMQFVEDNYYVIRFRGRVQEYKYRTQVEAKEHNAENSDKVLPGWYGDATYSSNYYPLQMHIGSKTEMGLLTDTPIITQNSKYIVGLHGFTNGADHFPLAGADNSKDLLITQDTTNDADGYYCIKFKASKDLASIPKGELAIAFWTSAATSKDLAWHIQDIQLFEYKTVKEKVIDENGQETEEEHVVFPGDTILNENVENVYSKFYTISKDGVKDSVYELSRDTTKYKIIIDQGYNSFLEYSTKDSNYFNNISSLSEKFGVWVSFHVKHKKNGQLFLDENNLPIKTVRYHRYAPSSTDYSHAPAGEVRVGPGFKYSVNLNGITRKIVSDDLATRVIVKANNNEHAENGQCNIARAKDNPSKNNVIYNFNYYIDRGILDSETVLSDLYGGDATSNDHTIAYYRKAAELNEKILELSSRFYAWQTELQMNREYLAAAEVSVEEYSIKKQEAYDEYISAHNSLAEHDPSNDWIVSKAIEYAEAASGLKQAKESYEKYQKLVEDLEKKLYSADYQYRGLWTKNERYQSGDVVMNEDGELYRSTVYMISSDSINPAWSIFSEDSVKDLETQIRILQDKKRLLTQRFHVTYSTYIQEGTFASDQFIDDNAYYLEARNAADQSSYPKVSYDIKVLDVGDIDSFEAFKFNVGDRTYIEDPTMFGYKITNINGEEVKTPKAKPIVITERTRVLDNPAKNSLKVQSFQNQFEDLFSKLSATTTSLQYASGAYSRAANAIQASGELKMATLEKAMQNNAYVLSNTKNQNVTWTPDTGIEVTDTSNPFNKLRLTSNGIMMTSDGGNTWINGITGEGINTKMLTAGQIDASLINIFSKSGDKYSFGWNADGITAYLDNSLDNFVRFSKYGFIIPKEGTGSSVNAYLAGNTTFDDKIDYLKKQKVYLGADGLFLNQDIGTSTTGTTINSIELGSEGLKIKAGDQVRAVLGQLNDASIFNNKVCGLFLFNSSGKVTFGADYSGNLWLKDKITIGGSSASTSLVGISGNSSDYAFWAGTVANNPKFSVTHSGILNAVDGIFEGSITADEGSIGNWRIKKNHLWGMNDDGTYTVLKSGGDVAIALGAKNDPSNVDSYDTTGANIRLYHNGKLQAGRMTRTNYTDRYALETYNDNTSALGYQVRVGGFYANNNSFCDSRGPSNFGSSVFICGYDEKQQTIGTQAPYSIGGSDNLAHWCFGAAGNWGVTKDGEMWGNNVHITGGEIRGQDYSLNICGTALWWGDKGDWNWFSQNDKEITMWNYWGAYIKLFNNLSSDVSCAYFGQDGVLLGTPNSSNVGWFDKDAIGFQHGDSNMLGQSCYGAKEMYISGVGSFVDEGVADFNHQTKNKIHMHLVDSTYKHNAYLTGEKIQFYEGLSSTSYSIATLDYQSLFVETHGGLTASVTLNGFYIGFSNEYARLRHNSLSINDSSNSLALHSDGFNFSKDSISATCSWNSGDGAWRFKVEDSSSGGHGAWLGKKGIEIYKEGTGVQWRFPNAQSGLGDVIFYLPDANGAWYRYKISVNTAGYLIATKSS